uniref:Stromelysin-2-like n=1 Tax=Petromyzon marinus TaxID=7757 RepID=A0AAJ7WUG9_PETMA|nr:stromelysin-2-like [Petromyzon marinus]
MPCVPYNMQVLGERDLELHDDEYEMASSLSNAFGFDDGDANRRDLWSGDLWSEGSSDESQRHAQPSPVNGDSSFVVEDLTVSQPGYCGVPNPNSFSLYPSRNKWLKKNLTYRFVNYPSGMSRERAEDALAEAFDLWRSVSTLTFQMLREGEADIMISFERRYHGDEFPFDGPHGVLAHAYEPSPGLGGDLHFDDEEQWSVGLIGASGCSCSTSACDRGLGSWAYNQKPKRHPGLNFSLVCFENATRLFFKSGILLAVGHCH